MKLATTEFVSNLNASCIPTSATLNIAPGYEDPNVPVVIKVDLQCLMISHMGEAIHRVTDDSLWVIHERVNEIELAGTRVRSCCTWDAANDRLLTKHTIIGIEKVEAWVREELKKLA